MTRLGPTAAWSLLAALCIGAAFALAGPPTAALALLALGLAVARHRSGLAWFTLSSLALNALILATAQPYGDHVLGLGPWHLGSTGFRTGLEAGSRLAAVVALNVGTLQRVGAEHLVEGLRLGRRTTGRLAAVLLAARDVADDARRLVMARRAVGAWPRSLWRRAAAVGPLVPALVAASLRRAHVRRDALHLLGIPTGRHFTPIVAVTAMAIAGRMPFFGVPNIKLTYVAVFVGGMVFGGRVGAAAGLLSMAVTNLMLTGLEPDAFANAPAMALVGLAGGAFRGLGRHDGARAADRWATRLAAGIVGVVLTMVFSVASDAATWLILAEADFSLASLRARLLAGLAFNVVPALVNGVLFGAAVGPVARGLRDLHGPATANPADPPLES